MREFKVYKGIPYRYIVRKDRYWHVSHVESIDEDTYFSVQLHEYPGLETTTEVNNGYMLATLGARNLPNDVRFNGMRGVVAPAGSRLVDICGYYNFMTNGAPVMDMESGVVSGFNATNYLTKTVTLPEVFTIYVKFTLTATGSNNIILSNQTTGASPIRSDALKLKAWSSSGNGGDFALVSGKTYWAKGIVTGASYYLYGMEDTGLTLEEAMASENWELSWSCDSDWMFKTDEANELNWGRNTSSYTSQYFNGSIDLACTRIFAGQTTLWSPWGTSGIVMQGMLAPGLQDVPEAKEYNMFYAAGKIYFDTVEKRDGEMWVGTVNIPAHEIKTPPSMNFTTVGDVVINDNMAQFKSGSALVTDKGLPQSGFFAQDSRFVARVTTGSSVTAVQDIFWDNNTHDHGFGIYNRKWRIWHGAAATGGTVAANTTYWVMLVQRVNSGSKLYYMVDDGSYTHNNLPGLEAWVAGPVISENLFNSVGGNFRIGNGYCSTVEAWQGTIDIKNLYIDTTEVNTDFWSTWWSAV